MTMKNTFRSWNIRT